MKTHLPARLPLLTCLLASLAGHAADGKEKSAKTSIPEIARIGKIQIGYSTQEEIEKRWGEGKTTVGGHSNSGRLWRVKGTNWILHTDGFEYSMRGGLLVDQLDLYEDPGLAGDRQLMREGPVTRLGKADFAWLGGISPGMTKAKVMRFLKSKSVPFIATKDGWEVSAVGLHGLQNHIWKKTWKANLVFANGKLSRLALEAIGEFKL